MIKKLFILPFVLLLITACNNKEQQNLDKPVRMETTTPFFEFNSVTYFHSDLTTTEWTEIANKRDKKTQDEQNLSDLLTGKIITPKP